MKEKTNFKRNKYNCDHKKIYLNYIRTDGYLAEWLEH